MLTRSAAVLQVNSRAMGAMKELFVEKLGFSVGVEAGRHAHFVTLDRDGQTIMLNCSGGPLSLPPKKGWAAYFWVESIDTLYEEFTSRGAPLKGGITDKPYGCREIVIVTPDRREIVFGELM